MSVSPDGRPYCRIGPVANHMEDRVQNLWLGKVLGRYGPSGMLHRLTSFTGWAISSQRAGYRGGESISWQACRSAGTLSSVKNTPDVSTGPEPRHKNVPPRSRAEQKKERVQQKEARCSRDLQLTGFGRGLSASAWADPCSIPS